ncbi:hypothetical protein [Sphingomonas phyllosphaerae]|uniref:hypothetical protein n=1 Tax=Sphingomonas phyllosphaerae TaxID=257003 RepID=UPI0003B6A4F6|nr:hypothetical protein [Sphingomonas phyllosphaerae]
MSDLSPREISDIKAAESGVEVEAGASDGAARYDRLAAAGYVKEIEGPAPNRAWIITAKGYEAIADAV